MPKKLNLASINKLCIPPHVSQGNLATKSLVSTGFAAEAMFLKSLINFKHSFMNLSPPCSLSQLLLLLFTLLLLLLL